MKERVAFSLVVLTLVLFLFSCASEEVTISMDYPDYDDVVNFNGTEFVMRDLVHHGDTPLIPTYGDNSLDDMMLSKYKQTEHDLNCTITRLVGTTGDFTTNTLCGTVYCDFMNDYFSSIYSHVKGGLAFDLRYLDGMDLTSGQFGKQNVLDAVSYGDGRYGFVAEYWGIPTPYFAEAVLFNPRLIQKYAQVSPLEHFENGTWNWDTFEAECIAVTDTTSNSDKPNYATGYNGYFIRSAFFSNGCTLVRKQDDGRLVFNLPSDEATEAVDFMKKLNNDDKIFSPSLGSWEAYCDMLIEGQYTFLCEYSWVGLSKDNGRVGLYMEEEFDWIPFPRGPHGNTEHLATFADANFAIFVPVNANTWSVGYLFTELFSPLYDTPYGWHDDFRREVFWNDESFDIYIKMLDSAVSDYCLLVSKVSPLTIIESAVSGKVSAKEKLESIAEQAQAQLDNEYNRLLENVR